MNNDNKRIYDMITKERLDGMSYRETVIEMVRTLLSSLPDHVLECVGKYSYHGTPIGRIVLDEEDGTVWMDAFDDNGSVSDTFTLHGSLCDEDVDSVFGLFDGFKAEIVRQYFSYVWSTGKEPSFVEFVLEGSLGGGVIDECGCKFYTIERLLSDMPDGVTDCKTVRMK